MLKILKFKQLKYLSENLFEYSIKTLFLCNLHSDISDVNFDCDFHNQYQEIFDLHFEQIKSDLMLWKTWSNVIHEMAKDPLQIRIGSNNFRLICWYCQKYLFWMVGNSEMILLDMIVRKHKTRTNNGLQFDFLTWLRDIWLVLTSEFLPGLDPGGHLSQEGNRIKWA